MKTLKVRRILFSLLAILAVAVFMTSCEQEALQVENLPEFQSSEVLFAKHDYLPDEIPDFQGNPPLEPQSIYEAARTLEEELGKEFRWSMVDDFMLWSSVKAGETSLISIGYKKDVPVYKGNKTSTREQILDFIVAELQKKKPGENVSILDIKPQYFKYLDAVMIEVDDYEILGKLRRLKTARYVEPESFDIESLILPNINHRAETQIGLGCGDGNAVPDSDISRRFSHNNNSRIPWQYDTDANNLVGAWDHSNKGEGVTIALIDTGVNSGQSLLGSQFATGESSGRTISKRAIAAGGWDDDCAHGTTMAGQIAGPLNNAGGIIGAAYKANLISFRVSDDVWLQMSWERHNVVDAIEEIVEGGEAKIIALAMGRQFRSRILQDACELADDHDILMICAAGSLATDEFLGSDPFWDFHIGDLYPARYRSTIAVTAVDLNNNGLNLSVAGPNAKGDYVDFAVFLKRNTDLEEWGGGMKMTGNDLRRARGSSAGVATLSGIAALILSNGDWHDKDLIIDRMKHSASIFTQENRRDDDFGWGVVDAEKAVIRANPWFYDCNVLGPAGISGFTLPTTFDYDYDSNFWAPKTWFVRNRNDGFTWADQSAGIITFHAFGEFEICCETPDCTDCRMVEVDAGG